MKTEQIRQLLDKFYAGETSENEEASLAEFFRGENLPSEFSADQKLFGALAKCAQEVPAGLEEKISLFIDRLNKEQPEMRKRTHKSYMWSRVAGAAASVALIASIGLWQYSAAQKNKVRADTYRSPEEAREATLKALELFSQNLSKGLEPVQKANKELEKTQEIVNQTLNTEK